MSKHTKGPWRYDAGSREVCAGFVVCTMATQGDDEGTDATAALIASAPEMFDRIASLSAENARMRSIDSGIAAASIAKLYDERTKSERLCEALAEIQSHASCYTEKPDKVLGIIADRARTALARAGGGT